MSDDISGQQDSATHDNTITVEAEYSLPDCERAIVHHWTFNGVPPQEAKDRVVSNYVPLEATLWRVCLWHGSQEDCPDSGHEEGILE